MAAADPMRVYGSRASYFTGKLEGYLRYKQIPYVFRPMTADLFNRVVPERTGARQMPAVELPDGRWMTDTTPIIAWFEQQYPHFPVLPGDPVQAFVCRLIEDYADEWLWRPAMHYRWSYFAGRHLLGIALTDELLGEVAGPAFLKRWMIRRRQKTHFVDRDGVSPRTRAHVERGYLHLLEVLQPVFDARPFVLGELPSLADFGLFGPLFRHFALDPTPAAIMRERSPAVYEWVARLWNARGSRLCGAWLDGVPTDLEPLLEEIGETHLCSLAANARAWRGGRKRHDPEIQGTAYRDVPVSRYRVWCLEQLQAAFQALDGSEAQAVERLLQEHRCWEPLWEVRDARSQYDPSGRAPFGVGLAVYEVPAP